MHFPITFHVGSAVIHLHFLFEMLAFFLAYRYYSFLRISYPDPISDQNRFRILIGASIGAFLGAHFIGMLEHPERPHFWSLFSFLGNVTIIGGLLGGLFAVELTKMIFSERNSSGDLMVFPLLLGLVIGRLGCLSEGITEETYGKMTSLSWGMDLGDGLKRHPTNLYEIIFISLLWLVLAAVDRRKILSNGSLFKLFLCAYLLFRFMIEFIKPDHLIIVQLSTLQLACIAGLLYYYKVFIFPGRLLKVKETTQHGIAACNAIKRDALSG